MEKGREEVLQKKGFVSNRTTSRLTSSANLTKTSMRRRRRRRRRRRKYQFYHLFITYLLKVSQLGKLSCPYQNHCPRLMIDSGTTVTSLQEDAFDMLKQAFVAQTKLQVSYSYTAKFDLCFDLPSNIVKEISSPDWFFISRD